MENAGTRYADKHFTELVNFRHEIFFEKEPGCSNVINMVHQYFNSRLVSLNLIRQISIKIAEQAVGEVWNADSKLIACLSFLTVFIN